MNENKIFEDLQKTKDYYENILRLIPAGIIIVGKNKKIRTINAFAMKMIGAKSEDQVIGKTCHNFICPACEGKCPIIDLGEKVDNSERILLNKNRERLPILKTVTEVMIEKENYLLEIFLDISERKIAEAEKTKFQTQLHQSEKMAAVGQLAGGVAHEINNPLTVILGYTQLTLRKLKPGDDLLKPLEMIEKEAIRCKKLVENLLTFSRSSNLVPQPENINKAIKEALALVEIQGKMKFVSISADYNKNLPDVMIDVSQIQQIIINLCNNAMDAMPEGGKIKIKTGQDDHNIEILVSDNGAGISEENKKRLFEPFFTTKEVGKGTGLGLSLCYEITKKHHGKISVESELGKGTTFTIRLPKIEVTPENINKNGGGWISKIIKFW